MQASHFAMLFGAALCLAGCLPPTTSHPVGTTVGLTNDPALTGLWRAKTGSADDGEFYLHFLPASDGTITVVMVQSGDKPDGDWSVASITTATLGANHYINAQLQFSDGKPADPGDTTDMTPLLYRLDSPNYLTLFFMDEDDTKDAIRSGQIKGTVTEGQFGDAKITADPNRSTHSWQASVGRPCSANALRP